MVPVSQLLAGKGKEIFSLPPDAPVLQAIQLMAEKSVGALLVMDGEQLLGILSERDYARKVILKGRSSKDTPVSAIMTPAPLFTVSPHSRTKECMRLMTDRRIRHLPVVEDGKVIGMLSIGDLVRSIIVGLEGEVEQLKQYIAG